MTTITVERRRLQLFRNSEKLTNRLRFQNTTKKTHREKRATDQKSQKQNTQLRTQRSLRMKLNALKICCFRFQPMSPQLFSPILHFFYRCIMLFSISTVLIQNQQNRSKERNLIIRDRLSIAHHTIVQNAQLFFIFYAVWFTNNQNHASMPSDWTLWIFRIDDKKTRRSVLPRAINSKRKSFIWGFCSSHSQWSRRVKFNSILKKIASNRKWSSVLRMVENVEPICA